MDQDETDLSSENFVDGGDGYFYDDINGVSFYDGD